jgi:hypothetical protein
MIGRAEWKLALNRRLTMTERDGRIGKTDGEFSVCQFFQNGHYEYVRRWVGIDEAIRAYQFYTQNVAAKFGMVVKVIVVDGGDCTNMEWQYGRGMVYPTKEVIDRSLAEQEPKNEQE